MYVCGREPVLQYAAAAESESVELLGPYDLEVVNHRRDFCMACCNIALYLLPQFFPCFGLG